MPLHRYTKNDMLMFQIAVDEHLVEDFLDTFGHYYVSYNQPLLQRSLKSELPKL